MTILQEGGELQLLLQNEREKKKKKRIDSSSSIDFTTGVLGRRDVFLSVTFSINFFGDLTLET